jgi:hypothetical protein
MLRFGRERLLLKVLPIELPRSHLPIATVTLKNRTLSSMAQLFIKCARELAKPLAGWYRQPSDQWREVAFWHHSDEPNTAGNVSSLGLSGRISAKQLAFGTLNIMHGARQDSRAHPMRLSL